jgi:metal-responsive CopG/Arc/MetJ family transcriptional regulator
MRSLDQSAKREGLTRSEFVRESLRNSLFDMKFEELHSYGVAKARAKGFKTEEQILRAAS